MVTTAERVAQANRVLMEGFERQDPAMVASVYDENAQVLPANSSPVVGKKAIQDFWGEVFEGLGVKRVNLKTVNIEEEGDLIVERGDYELFDAGGNRMQTGNYIVVSKHGRLIYDIFHSDQAAS
ncbi:MAG: nuclear transport factor 2 family protein [Dehalococcoidia bacterium]